MTEETKRTDITDVLEYAAQAVLATSYRAVGCTNCAECDRLDSYAALLRSLAAACKAYRKAYEKWNATPRAVISGAPVRFAVYDVTESALLALARGDTPNHTEHPTDD